LELILLKHLSAASLSLEGFLSTKHFRIIIAREALGKEFVPYERQE
jgi:hypothetical protein